MMINMMKVMMVALAIGASLNANAVTKNWIATVTQVQIDGNFFGGCIAIVSPGPEVQGLNGCNPGFVTMDCQGLLGGERATGQNALAAMQLALVTNTQVKIWVQDNKNINGVCYLRGVRNLTAAP